jgi:hypothetical protein
MLAPFVGIFLVELGKFVLYASLLMTQRRRFRDLSNCCKRGPAKKSSALSLSSERLGVTLRWRLITE